MQRFFCDQLRGLVLTGKEAGAATCDAQVELDPQESHHASRVLRLERGEEVELLDGQGRIAIGAVASTGKHVTVRVRSLRVVPMTLPALDIAVAIPKGPRADAMVEQLSQLGVDRLIPLRTARSVVDPREHKLERFARAAIESAKQCGRAYFMDVSETMDFAPLLRTTDHNLKLIASPGGMQAPAFARLREARRVLVLIGPEGGWTEQELGDAEAAGCRPWSLGPHVMRIETAATAAAAIVRHESHR